MTVRSEKVEFTGALGETLAARLDSGPGRPRAYALFAHCFTCSKDVFAAARIATALAERGIAVLRFDFTGLGASGGEFANTNFSSNVEDLVAAADYLRERDAAPSLLIGHSLGGAAVLAAAARIAEAKAVVTIAAPADPEHIRHLFTDDMERIEKDGEAEVAIAGRPFTIRRQFIEDISEQKSREAIAGLRKALLVFHSPRDEIVSVDNAARIYTAAKHPKSFVSLDDADHLLTRKDDAVYVADVIAAWAKRYLAAEIVADAQEGEDDRVTVSENGNGSFGQDITVGPHLLHADEPPDVGGRNAGPTPYQFLSAALGACTTMTLRMYADRKKIALDHVSVTVRHGKVHATDCAECETKEGKIDRFERELTLVGDLDEETTARLLEIADKCPVHRTLHSEVSIATRLAGG
ncbi:MAG: alpha/beta fold hydrolase [Rhodospirillaceae bacterium]